MDVAAILDGLKTEKERVEQTIAALEALLPPGVNVNGKPAEKRRGRKFMAPSERWEVSQRMKRYWASRRAHRKP
jgi:hypothetical protein